MTHRLTTNYAKNYCNRTLIVKVIVENVVTCFLGHGVVRVPSPGFGLRLVQVSPVRVSVHGHLYKDNSTHVYRQFPVKSNRENALRKSKNIPLHR